MTIEIVSKIDQISVDEFGSISVRRVDVIMENGIEVARKPPHRHVIHPGDDYSKEDVRVSAIAAAVHTDAVVQARAELLAAQAK